jgi:Family of unknown function (DUF5335)
MPTQEIPRHEWTSFFDGFSGCHEDWLVSIETFGPNQDPQVRAQNLPLRLVTAELKEDGEAVISIALGDGAQEDVTYTVTEAVFVKLQQTEEGADEAVYIGSNSSVTILRFRSPMLPEMVDGLLIRSHR